MKVTKLINSNYKNARRVEIVPDADGKLVIIEGNNGAGKSSVLDSIAAALGGVDSKNTPKPIRDGQSSAEIIVETEELTVTRRFTPSGSTLSVMSKDGAKFSKGQAKLDELVGKLSLDPFAFTQLDNKKQLAQLLDLVDLPFDPAQLDAERKAVFDERTAVNRDVKELAAQLQAYGDTPEGLPESEVSVAELLGEYREAEALARRQQDDHNGLASSRAKAQATVAEIKRLQLQLEEHNKDIETAEAAIRNHAPLPDLDAIQSQIDGAEETNRQVRKAQERAALAERHTATADRAAQLTAKIDKIDTDKADMLASATFPVPGLGFDENGVTYRGVPFKQASTAEQIRVSMGMAIALNPKLRIIRIADGSLLDQNSLALVEEMATKHDYQVWLEVVGEGRDGAFTIVDGELA